MSPETRIRTWSFISLIVFIASIVAPIEIIYRGYFASAFVAFTVALTIFCLCVGKAINNQPGGLIIDSRNRMSLSKLQAAAWTIIVLSGWATYVFVRLRTGSTADTVTNAVNVAFPEALLAAMGISATTLVAAPIVLSTKTPNTLSVIQAQDAAIKIGDQPQDVAARGGVYARKDAGSAKWLDLFLGDDVGNAGNADLSKMQQFLITVVVLIVYSASIFDMLHSAAKDIASVAVKLQELPPLGENFVWLIGISHAGYLGYKAAPHPGNDSTPTPRPDVTDDATAHG